MRVLRITIARMMALVLVCGMGFATLTRPSPLNVSLAFTTMLTVLIYAILAATRGQHRTFWLGFAISGWAYASCAFAPGAPFEVRPFLLTSHALNFLYPRLIDADSGRWGSTKPNNAYHNNIEANDWIRYDHMLVYGRFQRIGHSWATLAHGIVGGWVLVWLAARNPTEDHA